MCALRTEMSKKQLWACPFHICLSNCPPCLFVTCLDFLLTVGPRVWKLMFFCSPAQRKCRHWYIKLIYFCYLPRLVECSPQIIYDIGTKILYFQCFVTTDMFLFCKPIIFSGNCRICRDLAFGSVKTRFKAILKNWIFRPRSTFSWTFAPGGRLRYEAYNVFTFLIYIYITFTFTLLFFMGFFTTRNLAQYPHRSALQAPYFACAEIWWIAMFLAYQRASRPYKRLVFDDFTFFKLYIFFKMTILIPSPPRSYRHLAGVRYNISFVTELSRPPGAKVK